MRRLPSQGPRPTPLPPAHLSVARPLVRAPVRTPHARISHLRIQASARTCATGRFLSNTLQECRARSEPAGPRGRCVDDRRSSRSRADGRAACGAAPDAGACAMPGLSSVAKHARDEGLVDAGRRGLARFCLSCSQEGGQPGSRWPAWEIVRTNWGRAEGWGRDGGDRCASPPIIVISEQSTRCVKIDMGSRSCECDAPCRGQLCPVKY